MKPEGPKTPTRVLIVDDEGLFCWWVGETLTARGDLVTEARSGAQAIDALRNAREPFDAVLLDYSLPDVRGLSLLSTVKQMSPSSRVILVSAHYTPELATAAAAMGAASVVSKPIDMYEVSSLVHGGLKEKKL